MSSLKRRLDDLKRDFESAFLKLDIDKKLSQQKKIEHEVAEPEIWNNPSLAKAKNEELSRLNGLTDKWQIMKVQLSDLNELMELGDSDLESEFNEQVTALENDFKLMKKDLSMTGKYDSGSAILRLTSGVGGLDAQDFTEMLERMYLRFSEKEGIKASIIERQKSDEAGVKTSVIELSAPYAYGKMKSEHGTHRLVRLSPFNADNLRQTSFALVEVLPKITQKEVELNDKDVKVDVYRAGGHGGQSVNTTDSAVRVTHIPTGITVSIQNERSQVQNKQTAFEILYSKLAQLQLEQNAENINALRSGKSADWGTQIRNYVLHPYTLVKDTRTKYEDRDVESVLDGKISGFIEAYQDYVLGS